MEAPRFSFLIPSPLVALPCGSRSITRTRFPATLMYAQIDRCCTLTYPALLIDDGDSSAHGPTPDPFSAIPPMHSKQSSFSKTSFPSLSSLRPEGTLLRNPRPPRIGRRRGMHLLIPNKSPSPAASGQFQPLQRRGLHTQRLGCRLCLSHLFLNLRPLHGDESASDFDQGNAVFQQYGQT